MVEIGGEGVEADARDEASRGERAVVPIVGSFEIDATGAGLVVGGAHRKPKGDPATLVGRFARGSRGGFEVGEIQLSVRKANR